MYKSRTSYSFDQMRLSHETPETVKRKTNLPRFLSFFNTCQPNEAIFRLKFNLLPTIFR